MSEIGYYRYKTTADQEKTIYLTINYTRVGVSKTIVPVNTCEGDLIIKYLDKNGQYRFYPFNNLYRTFDEPEKIGSANKFVTNILSDQAREQNIGFRNKRKISMRADVPSDHLEKLVDIYTSPRVYLYIGLGSTDQAEDWVEVDQISDNPIVRNRDKNMSQILITITLPENFSVTMI